jgi:rod shape-determining protein MreC
MPPFEPDSSSPGGRTDLLVSLGFVMLAGILMVLPPENQEAISAAVRASIMAPFIWTQESLHETRARTVDVERLQAELDSLVAELTSRHTLAEENQRLRELLDLRERAGPGFVPATAIRPGTRGSESMFLLDVGRRDGVGVNDPIVTAGGLVGVVRSVGARTALAMDWTHPDFRASVMTNDGAAYGIVEPVQGAFREEDTLLLGGIPYHTALGPGEGLVTSGTGGVYPRGIPVGMVEGVAETEAGWQRSYRVRPAVEPGSVTHVLVLTTAAAMAESREELGRLWTGGGDPP